MDEEESIKTSDQKEDIKFTVKIENRYDSVSVIGDNGNDTDNKNKNKEYENEGTTTQIVTVKKGETECSPTKKLGKPSKREAMKLDLRSPKLIYKEGLNQNMERKITTLRNFFSEKGKDSDQNTDLKQHPYPSRFSKQQ